MFNYEHLEFFENSCQHYSDILQDAIESLLSLGHERYFKVLELGIGTGGLTKLITKKISFLLLLITKTDTQGLVFKWQILEPKKWMF